MAIHVDVLVRLHERQLKQASSKLKREATALGEDLSDRIAKPLKNVAPGAVKALDSMTDGTVRLQRQTDALIAVLKDSEATDKDRRRALEDFSKATRDADRAVKGFTETNERELKQSRQRAYIMGMNTKAFKDFKDQIDVTRQSIGQLRQDNDATIASHNALTKSFDRVTDAADKTTRAHDRYNEMVKDGTASRDQLRRQSYAVRDAYTAEHRAIRDATDSLGRHSEAQRKESERAQRRADADRKRRGGEAHLGSWAARNLGALTPLGVVTPTLVLPLGMAFTQVANAAVAASQSIGLLPAVVAMAGAGMGTLKLATAGFSDTIQALAQGDLEKFATLIQGLSPNAQQAALHIQNVLPQLKAMQQATQDAFFSGSGEMIHNLTGTYLPMIRELTTGIAGTFNEGMHKVYSQLMTPEMQTQVGGITQNIAKAFQALLPAVQPFVDALTSLTSVGSTMLPGMVTDVVSLVQNFASFIDKSRQSGDLAKSMQLGWDSLKAVGEAVFNFGKMLYDVFGLKSQQDIQAFKDTMRDFTDIVSIMLGTLKTFFTDVGNTFRAIYNFTSPIHEVTDAFGGWERVLSSIIEVYLGARLLAALAKAGEAFKIFAGTAKTSAEVAATATAAQGATAGTGFAGKAAGALRAFGWAALGGWIGLQIGNAITNNPTIANFQKGRTDPLFNNSVSQWVREHTPEWLGGNPWDPKPTTPPRPQDPLAPKPTRPTLPALTPMDILSGGAPVVRNPLDVLNPGAPMPQLHPNYGASRDRYQPPPVGTPAPFPGDLPVPAAPPDPGSKPSESDVLNDIRGKLDPSTYTVNPFEGLNLPPALAGSTAGGNPFMPQPSSGQPGMDARTFANDVMKPYWESMGLTVGDHGADQHGEHQNGALDIMVPDLGTGQQVLDKVLQDPNVYGAIFNNKTYGYGHGATPQDYGSTGGPTDRHEDHVHAWYGNGARAGATLSPGAGGLGNGNTYGPLSYNNSNPYDPAGLGYYQQDQGAIIDARNDVIQKAHDYEEKKKDLAAAEQSGLKSDEELGDLRWSVYRAESDWRDAQTKLGESLTGKFKELNDSTNNVMKDVGAELDADFGISQGLSGIAKNLTMFLGNLAFAPMAGQLQATQQANEQATGIQGGFGLLGQMGAQNLAAGKSPFFGRQLNATGNNGGLASLFGGGGGGAGAGAPAGLGGAAGALTQPHRLDWNGVAQGESGGNWAINTGNGFYGGLQFTQSSWEAAGGTAIAPRADLASPQDQMAIADRLYDMQGPGAWPNTAHLGQQPAGFATGGPVPLGNPNYPWNPGGFGNQPGMQGTESWGDNPAGIIPPKMGPSTGGFQVTPGPWPIPAWTRGGKNKHYGPGGIDGASNRIAPSDTVPAMLTPGEYVVNKQATNLWRPFLEHINGFAAGGQVDENGNPTQYGGAYGAGKGTGAGGVGLTPGGTLDTAMGLAASAVPGLGQAAATGMKLGSRAIQYAGQVAGIGVQGLMETFLPTGGSELANNNWLTRIVGGLAGAAPAIPNIAGQMTQQAQQNQPTANEMIPPMPLGDQHLPPGGAQQPGPTINVEYNNYKAPEDRAAADLLTGLRPLVGSR